MKMTFSYEAGDFLQSYLYTQARKENNKKQKRKTIITYLIVLVTITIIVGSKDVVAGSVFFIIFGVILIWNFKKGIKDKYKKIYSKFVNDNLKERFGVPIEFTLSPDSILTIDKTGEFKVNTTNIKSITETKEYYFMALRTSGNLIFPKNKINDLNNLEVAFTNMGVTITRDLDWEW